MQQHGYTGVVLKREPLKEADEVITLWSVEAGKIRLLSRGVKHPHSKLRWMLAPLAWIEINAVSRTTLPIVSGGRVVRTYHKAAGSLQQFAVLSTLFELVIRATPDREQNDFLSVLLRDTLDYMESGAALDLHFLNFFLLKLVAALGYGLQFDYCAQCQSPLPQAERTAFSYLLSGLVCSRCRKSAHEVEVIPVVTVTYMLVIASTTQFLGKSSAEPETIGGAYALLSKFIRFVLDREVRSESFLKTQLS